MHQQLNGLCKDLGKELLGVADGVFCCEFRRKKVAQQPQHGLATDQVVTVCMQGTQSAASVQACLEAEPGQLWGVSLWMRDAELNRAWKVRSGGAPASTRSCTPREGQGCWHSRSRGSSSSSAGGACQWPSTCSGPFHAQ